MRFELPLSEERVKPHQVAALHLFVAFILIITASLVLVTYAAASRLPEDKVASYRLVLYYGQAFSILLYAISLVLITTVLTRNRWLQKPLNNLLFRIAEFLLIAMLFIGSLVSGLMIPAVIFAVLAATIIVAINWERKRNIPLLITIDKEGIRPPVFARTRIIEWNEIEHVLLRFDTLTINCADNRLFQWNVGTYNFQPDVFEVFCIRQVDKAKESRDKNDW